jgi:hypothetical protein
MVLTNDQTPPYQKQSLLSFLFLPIHLQRQAAFLSNHSEYAIFCKYFNKLEESIQMLASVILLQLEGTPMNFSGHKGLRLNM